MKNYKKTEHFKPIAMKCTQEQFNELKPILKKFSFKINENCKLDEVYCNLVNNSFGNKKHINSFTETNLSNNRTYHKKFNAETFLKACGIVEVEKTYQLSETFVKELCKEPNIKEAFVREGIIEDDKFVNGYYGNKLNSMVCIYFDNKKGVYGIDGTNKWYDDLSDMIFSNNNYLLTPQEVEIALINEAKKRGYENGNYKCLRIEEETMEIKEDCFFYNSKSNILSQGLKNHLYNDVFNNGTWAEIIKPEKYVKIPQSLIDNTPDDLELGRLVRNFK